MQEESSTMDREHLSAPPYHPPSPAFYNIIHHMARDSRSLMLMRRSTNLACGIQIPTITMTPK